MAAMQPALKTHELPTSTAHHRLLCRRRHAVPGCKPVAHGGKERGHAEHMESPSDAEHMESPSDGRFVFRGGEARRTLSSIAMYRTDMPDAGWRARPTRRSQAPPVLRRPSGRGLPCHRQHVRRFPPAALNIATPQSDLQAAPRDSCLGETSAGCCMRWAVY